MRLEGKVALITGGGSGFGAAFARHFAREGARVAIVDLAEDNGERVAGEVRAAGGEALFVRADVARGAEVAAAVGAVTERFGGLDVVMNNAGIAQPRLAVTDTPEDLFDRLFAVNVRSVYLVTRHAVPVLRARGGGVIINTASTSALRPRPQNASYAASKAAVITLTKALAAELAPDKIRVNALAPVAADTPLFRAFVGDAGDELAARMAAAIPAGRLCTPDDMATCAVFLASDQAAFLTGVCLPVDGGWTAI